MDTSDLWTCPDCGKPFVTRNSWHSCARHTVDEFLGDKSAASWAYWAKLQAMVGACGAYTVIANKTRLVFMVRVRFAGMTSVSDRGMTFDFWLKQHIESPRFGRVEHVSGRDWVYTVRVESLDELDDEVQEWLCMAYKVGCQLA